jgi:DNA-binding transcriptional MerR regulator
MDTTVGHTLQGLASASGLPVRTLRYYLAQGLLPTPVRQGAGTRYPETTFRRLTLIRRLRAANMQLAEIRERLTAMSDEDVEAALEPHGLATQQALKAGVMRPPTYTVGPPGGALPASVSPMSPPGPEVPGLPVPSASPAGPPVARRSHWERITLEPGVELHIERPLTRIAAKRVERLVAYAHLLLEQDLAGLG